MGANEFGLVIGNTAVFTKEPYNKTGILGWINKISARTNKIRI